MSNADSYPFNGRALRGASVDSPVLPSNSVSSSPSISPFPMVFVFDGEDSSSETLEVERETSFPEISTTETVSPVPRASATSTRTSVITTLYPVNSIYDIMGNLTIFVKNEQGSQLEISVSRSDMILLVIVGIPEDPIEVIFNNHDPYDYPIQLTQQQIMSLKNLFFSGIVKIRLGGILTKRMTEEFLTLNLDSGKILLTESKFTRFVNWQF